MVSMRMGPLGYTFERCTQWDETGRTTISLIIVSFDEYSARSIQFGFIENEEELVMSKTYGTSYDCSRRVIRLNLDTEFVTGISGELDDNFYISSLTFHTNLRAHKAFHLKINAGDKACPPLKREFHSGILSRHEFEGFFGDYNDERLLTINFSVRHILSGVDRIKYE